jgi:NADH:ubiquinone oxidoreductase subunit E
VKNEKQELCCRYDSQLKEIDSFIDELAQRGSLDGKLIVILHKAQEILGYLPEEVQEYVACRLSIPPATVFGVVSFYSYFSMIPKGKYIINVCMGTACFVVGAKKVLEEFEKQLGIETGQTTPDGLFSLTALRCVGTCGIAPVVTVNEKTFGEVTREDVSGIIDEYRGGNDK